MSLQDLLSIHRDRISAAFVREVERKDLPPAKLPRSVLLDHIPVFLDEIAAELDRDSGARPSMLALELGATARQHGQQRWSSGYELEAVVREYGVLRRAILEVSRATRVPITVEEDDILDRYLNLGIAQATAEYVRSSEERLKAQHADLEFLSDAGELLGSSLDTQSTLAQLTRLLVPARADYCIVSLTGFNIEQTPVAHVDPTKVRLVRELLQRFSDPWGKPEQHGLLKDGGSALVEVVHPSLLEQIAVNPVHFDLLQQLGPCSWLIVPLRVQSSSVGSLMMAWSDSGRRYLQEDLLLAEDLARRAAMAIQNARLYELSRDERAKAEAAARTKDEFVAMVSHELRTPLNVIIGWLRLLRGGALPANTREHALDVVERNANAQSQLVGDLLDISRVISGKIRLDAAQVELGNLLEMVLEDARISIEAKRIQLHLEITPEPTLMRGDAERLKQVFWNLLLNAIKFTPKNGDIWVTLGRVASDLELTIRDSGVGMSAEFLPHAFESFRQSDSKTTRAHSGLGIGLSIAKHLVELHGGSIQAESAGLGQGASFVVRLPVSPVISTTVGVTKVSVTAIPRKDMTRPEVLAGLHALIVDDEEDARDLLRIVLEACGVTVHEASNVEQGLDQVAGEPLDFVISDIGMPGEDGYSFIRRLRALPNERQASIPALALTAFARNEDRTRALLEGFNAHMAKPVEPADLLLVLADLCAHSRPDRGA